MVFLKRFVYGTFLILFSFLLFTSVMRAAQAENLYNPLPVANELFCPTASCDLQTMVLLVLSDILRIIPIISVLFIIVGGFKMVMSQGNEEALTAAKRTIVWAVLGLVVAVLSFSIIAIVQNLLGVTIPT